MVDLEDGPVTTGGQRRRNRPKEQAWYNAYHDRITRGVERCRGCGADGSSNSNFLTFDHLRPHADGYKLTFFNATILCRRCQERKGADVWPHLLPLAAEEAQAPPENRWACKVYAERASERLAATRGSQLNPTSQIAERVLAVVLAATPGDRKSVV